MAVDDRGQLALRTQAGAEAAAELIALGGLVIALLRAFVGVRTFGTFMPVLIALAFRETELLWGLVLFSALVTADDPVAAKPAPDFYMEAARRLGVEPAGCVVFEDADSGIQSATAAGMRVVDVRVPAALKDFQAR